MKFSIVVMDSVDRICTVDIDADTEEDAVQEATEMWENGDLEDDMQECNDDPTFVDAYPAN